MPELTEDMYCSQQICIPPSFPYLLRQFAKAAIRTQPGDLLRWSTAYFRCLALNLPPPVKPRLEYPIPKSHFGLTPGWLKALVYQLQNNLTVPFKVLWDRWIGACLQHKNLIECLVLGGFTDPYAIEWFRFVAICAGHLTENLTQTMILICEILTEEPEGGSAMIPLEVFLDLYKYLAAIDASEPQWMRNLYFTDSLLSLYQEPLKEESKGSTVELEEVAEEESLEGEEEKAEEAREGPGKDMTGVVISCPDLAAGDYKKESDFELQAPLPEEESAKETERTEGPPAEEPEEEVATEDKTEEEKPEEKEDETEEKEDVVEEKESEAHKEGATQKESAVSKKEPAPETPSQISKPSELPEKPSTLGQPGEGDQTSVDTLIDYMPPRERDLELLEDLQKVKYAQYGDGEEEGGGEEEGDEVDYELEKLRYLLEGPQGSGIIESLISEGEEEKTELEEEPEEEEEEEKGELIFIEAIPGIGAIITAEMIEAVDKYMRECAVIQHGMVMPRNIRHYNCPPLEVFNKCSCVNKVC